MYTLTDALKLIRLNLQQLTVPSTYENMNKMLGILQLLDKIIETETEKESDTDGRQTDIGTDTGNTDQ